MWAKQPFERRLLLAFVLMTTLVSGLFSLSIVVVVRALEEHLVSEEMSRELAQVLDEDVRQGRAPRLDALTRFFTSESERYAIPEEYQGLAEGFTEVVRGNEAFYVYQQEGNGQLYLLVQEQHEFEAHEQALFDVVLAGFLLTMIGAAGLGTMMARKVMAPIRRLAEQVRHPDQLQPLAPLLAPAYPQDEIGQLAAAFDSTLSQVRQALERERLFTSDVSHELRTPLMVISTSCELLAEVPLGVREQQQLARIASANQEMLALVQTFLQLARDKSNASVAAPHDSLAGIAATQVARWQPLFADKGVAFQCLEKERDGGRYNTTLLATVIANLLRNALHYTEHGQVCLVLERGALRVEDSGIGIAVSEQAQIFEPFARGQNARGEGLGLGLSLVKRICTHQGWSLQLTSTPERGSCFRVVLAAA